MAKLHLPSNENVIAKTGAFSQVWNIFFGNVAKFADSISSVDQVANPDAASAPAAYSQAHVQTIVAELNETKQQLNALITALNT